MTVDPEKLRMEQELLTADEFQPTEERPEDALRRFAHRLVAIEELHQERHRSVGMRSAALRWCRECGQDWPCPTVQVVNGSSDRGAGDV